jgi:hypothetical protein
MISITKTILQINPNAEFEIADNDLSTIQWKEGTTPIATADIQAKYDELVSQENNKKADALAGNNKLLGLGLTQAEVTAMTGYTPPVSE